MADSPDVRPRNSATPASGVRAPSSLIPVPGLLNVRTVVVPPAAAAAVSRANRSGRAGSGRRRWVWTSIAPGSTRSPPASTRSAPGGTGRSGPTAWIVPAEMATSTEAAPAGVTTVPPMMTRSVTASSAGDRDLDLLRALPEHATPHLGQPLPALDDRREVIARERADPGAEAARSVRKEDLAFADLPGVDEELSRCRMAGVILIAHGRSPVAERDPGGLAAPLAVDEARSNRQPRLERGARVRGARLPGGGEFEVADGDRQVSHRRQDTPIRRASGPTARTARRARE